MSTASPWSIFRYESGDTIPTLTVPGETVVWERGAGDGEFYTFSGGGSTAMYGAEWRGQTFTIGTTAADTDFSITSVKMKLYRILSPGTVTLGIYATDVDGYPTGSPLTSGTTDGDTLTTNSEGEVRTFTLSPVTLTASTKYAIVIDARNGDANNQALYRGTTAAGYPAGEGVHSADSGSSWASLSGDYYFSTHGGGFYLLVNDSNNVTHYSTLTAYT